MISDYRKKTESDLKNVNLKEKMDHYCYLSNCRMAAEQLPINIMFTFISKNCKLALLLLL